MLIVGVVVVAVVPVMCKSCAACLERRRLLKTGSLLHLMLRVNNNRL